MVAAGTLAGGLMLSKEEVYGGANPGYRLIVVGLVMLGNSNGVLMGWRLRLK